MLNLLSNDVNGIEFSMGMIPPTFLTPLTMFMSGFIIYDYFGFFSLLGIAGLFGFMWISTYLSNKTEKYQNDKNTIMDERIKRTNELIECIRLIKMYAWEKPLSLIIEELRGREAIALLKTQLMNSFGFALANSSPLICIYIMGIGYILSGGILNPSKMYAAMMILNFARIWGVYFFHSGRMFIVRIRIMKKRLEDILNLDDVLSAEDIR